MTTATRRRSTRTARVQADPRGTHERTRRVTAVLGSKPNRLTWRAYHAIAQRDPWTLDAIRCARYSGPVALAPDPVVVPPLRALTYDEQLAVKRAHDDLAAGRIDGPGYLAALATLGAGITTTERTAR